MKNKKIIGGVIIAILLGYGILSIYKGNNSTIQVKNSNYKSSQTELTSEKELTSETDKTSKKDNDVHTKVDNIDSNSNSNSNSNINSNSEKYSQESLNNILEQNNYSLEISTPYKVGTTGLEIIKIKGNSDKFLENGSDNDIKNVLSLTVKNTSTKDIQYAQIILRTNKNDNIVFNITNLPAKSSVIVQESTGKVKYSNSEKYKYKSSTYGQVDSLPMNDDKIKVSTEGNKIGIENVSGKDLGTVYVYYKNIDKKGTYLGGITYRAKFDNVKKDDILVTETKHFSEGNSKIVMVDVEK